MEVKKEAWLLAANPRFSMDKLKHSGILTPIELNAMPLFSSERALNRYNRLQIKLDFTCVHQQGPKCEC